MKAERDGKNNEQALAPQKPRTKKITPKKALENRLADLLHRSPEFTGVKSVGMADGILYQVAAGLVHPRPKGDMAALVKALEIIREMAPEGPAQAMLAAQMVGVNEASARFLAVAFEDGHTLESRTSNVNRAVRLMQLFLLQVEAFEKLRGKSVQQKVVVEHVHVHEGGQAIVGTVTARVPGEGMGDGAENR
jgi:hypothetical protein